MTQFFLIEFFIYIHPPRLGWLGLNLHIFFFNLLSIILSHSHDSCNEFNELTWLTRFFFILFLIEWFLNPSSNVKLVWNWASWLFFNLFFCRGYSVIMTCVSSLTSLPSLTQVIFFIFFYLFSWISSFNFWLFKN